MIVSHMLCYWLILWLRVTIDGFTISPVFSGSRTRAAFHILPLSVSTPMEVSQFQNHSKEPMEPEQLQFLSSIINYGNNRMARRAVEVLKKMSSKVAPREEHYTAAIWACENSDQYETAKEVFREMKSMKIDRSIRTYEGMASVAERVGKYEDTIEYLDNARKEGLSLSTAIYNSCMWAADSARHPELALYLLDQMTTDKVKRDMTTYEAAIWACEKQGEGSKAISIIEMMREDGYLPSTAIMRASMWACVKGGQQSDALALFDGMSESGYSVIKDTGCFDAAIWACEQTDKYMRSVTLLKLMKLEGFKRSTISYDGTLSALSHAGDWKTALDVYTWMDREQPPVRRSPVTYKVMIEALDKAGDSMSGKAMSLLQDAQREGYFIPWIEGTRTIDLRFFSLPLAKLALINVLQQMANEKLNLFTMDMIVGDLLLNGETCSPDPDFAAEMVLVDGTRSDEGLGSSNPLDDDDEDEVMYAASCPFDEDEFEAFLKSLKVVDGIVSVVNDSNSLQIERNQNYEDLTTHFILSRETLQQLFGRE